MKGRPGIMLIAGLLFSLGCAPQPEPVVTNTYQVSKSSLSAKELVERLQAGEDLFVLDVREPEELHGPLGALPNVRNIPLGQISQQAETIPQDREVVVICRTGSRSRSAIQWLTSLGYKNLRNLNGGMSAVRRLLPDSRKK